MCAARFKLQLRQPTTIIQLNKALPAIGVISVKTALGSGDAWIYLSRLTYKLYLFIYFIRKKTIKNQQILFAVI